MNFETETEQQPLTSEQDAQLRQLTVARAPAALEEMDAAKTEAEFFSSLPGATLAAMHLERYAQAEELANENLRLAPSYKDNWNYGNAIHAAHTVLGLVALQNGNVQLAIGELKKSGETPGSPQLDTFGPSMQLAKALLQRGETATVLGYLQQCRTFWVMGTVWLDIWEDKINSGHIPNFVMHIYR
jgi:tetratricopeptide (TPR) repeat protein